MWVRASPGPVPAATFPPLCEALPRKMQSRASGERLGAWRRARASAHLGLAETGALPVVRDRGPWSQSCLGLCDPKEAQAEDGRSGSKTRQSLASAQVLRRVSYFL